MAAGVSCGYYFVDLPAIALWGARMAPISHHIERFFADCAAGTLPKVTFVDPGFTTGLRTDDHPYGDLRAGQNYAHNVFKAFRESPHWNEGVFFVTYDEWGGFFDHVDPPLAAADDTLTEFGDAVETTASTEHTISDDNWAQLGFRVPTIMASPFAKPGFVDHGVYEHSSILRFIEWSYLGAPAAGTGSDGDGWWLTARDRHAANIGLTLQSEQTGADVHLPEIARNPLPSVPCRGEELEGAFLPVSGVPEEVWNGVDALDGVVGDQRHEFERIMDGGFYEAMGHTVHLEHPGSDILGH
jgi:hypothetical protein